MTQRDLNILWWLLHICLGLMKLRRWSLNRSDTATSLFIDLCAMYRHKPQQLEKDRLMFPHSPSVNHGTRAITSPDKATVRPSAMSNLKIQLPWSKPSHLFGLRIIKSWLFWTFGRGVGVGHLTMLNVFKVSFKDEWEDMIIMYGELTRKEGKLQLTANLLPENLRGLRKTTQKPYLGHLGSTFLRGFRTGHFQIASFSSIVQLQVKVKAGR
jgi:hypothetical protein